MKLEEFRRRFARSSAHAADAPTVYGDEGPRPDPAGLRPAAVLVPVVARDPDNPAGPTVLLTRRAAHLRDHSGQVSFPGGRVHADDPSPEATALREAREEIGLDPVRVEVLGRMAEYHTRTGFRITPVVAIVTPPLRLHPDPNEVDEIFEVPLAFLMDPANHQRHSREWEGELRWFFAMPYHGHYIWGATAALLVNLSIRVAR